VNAQVLPLAITMMAGPQIMTAIVLVTHAEAVRVSLAFLIGVAVAASLGTTIAFLLADSFDLGDASDNASSGKVIQFVLVGLLLVLAIRTYVNRETVNPPKLGSLQQATPRKALTMGLLLIGVMPTDIASMLTVGVNLAHNDDSLLAALPFIPDLSNLIRFG
jgi:hypothetical protein